LALAAAGTSAYCLDLQQRVWKRCGQYFPRRGRHRNQNLATKASEATKRQLPVQDAAGILDAVADLADNKFDPRTDLFRDWQDIYQLTPDKPALRDAIRRYFASRNEDDPSLMPERLANYSYLRASIGSSFEAFHAG
jgi:hypothetical protein